MTAMFFLFLAGSATAGGVDPAAVKRVHLIQANHLDLGFSDLMARVMNRYLNGGRWSARGSCVTRVQRLFKVTTHFFARART
jgi:hypothetical protein